jgi:F-type H+-transporting ATPase subunit b
VNLNFTFILQILSFLILLFLLGKYLYKPFTKYLDDRAHEAGRIIGDAKEAEEKAQLYAQESQKALGEARQEALRVKEETKRTADKERRETVNQARSEAQRLIDEAKKQILKEQATAAEKVKKELGSLSVDIASRILKREIKPADHKRLIEDAIEEIEGGSH